MAAKHKPKIVRAKGAEDAPATEKPLFVADESAKSKALQQRLIAIGCWAVAIGLQVWAILLVQKWAAQPNMPLLIGLIIGDLILAVAGALLWKAANRLDPASKKEPVKFFIQNQLGVILAILAFLPLIVLILLSKDMNGNQKALAGGIAAVALAVAGIFGVSLNPPSIEEYSEQIAEVEGLTGKNLVYWTKSGSKFHLYADCYVINSNRTEEIIEGTVGQARELKNITELCSICRNRAQKNKELTSPQSSQQPETASPENPEPDAPTQPTPEPADAPVNSEAVPAEA